ncbi:hypothetical protein [Desulfitobacterium hafniense]|uniref:hypothetical protein n=1 Tax=Desulfitobacterium hafniense TaxID=49338 RepID=UPI001FA720BE|nr:hypothetical protein [Desulfitobacterium hafniense]
MDDGENPVNVSSLLGHAKTSTTLDIYGHSSLEGKAKAVSRLSNKIKAVKQPGHCDILVDKFLNELVIFIDNVHII